MRCDVGARGLTTPAKQPLDMKELQAKGEWVLIHFWDRYFILPHSSPLPVSVCVSGV